MKVLRLLSICFVLTLLSAVSFAQDVKLIFGIEGKGEFTMTLNQKAAPKTCTQILRLAESGFYNGQKFHRSVQKPRPFLIQVGDPASKGDKVDLEGSLLGGSGSRIPFEVNDLQCDAGAVGLALYPDQKDSGDSQFFVLLSPNRYLNGKYTIFAKITAGMEVIQRIAVGDKITAVRVVRG